MSRTLDMCADCQAAVVEQLGLLCDDCADALLLRHRDALRPALLPRIVPAAHVKTAGVQWSPATKTICPPRRGKEPASGWHQRGDIRGKAVTL